MPMTTTPFFLTSSNVPACDLPAAATAASANSAMPIWRRLIENNIWCFLLLVMAVFDWAGAPFLPLTGQGEPGLHPAAPP